MADGKSFHEREVVDLMALAMLPDHEAREPLHRWLRPQQSPAADAGVYQRLVSEGLAESHVEPGARSSEGGWLKRSAEGQVLVTELFGRVR